MTLISPQEDEIDELLEWASDYLKAHPEVCTNKCSGILTGKFAKHSGVKLNDTQIHALEISDKYWLENKKLYDSARLELLDTLAQQEKCLRPLLNGDPEFAINRLILNSLLDNAPLDAAVIEFDLMLAGDVGMCVDDMRAVLEDVFLRHSQPSLTRLDHSITQTFYWRDALTLKTRKTAMPILMIGAMLGFLAVALGAFGAHGLEGKLDSKAMEWWQTATLYALVHAAVITALGLTKRAGFAGGDLAGLAMIVGTIVFAGSLYAMALGAPRWFGAITPLGGVSLLIGWGLLIWAGTQSTP